MTIQNIYIARSFYKRIGEDKNKMDLACGALKVLYKHKANLDNINYIAGTEMHNWHYEEMENGDGRYTFRPCADRNYRVPYLINNGNYYIIDFWRHDEQDANANRKEAWHIPSNCIYFDDLLEDSVSQYLKNGSFIDWNAPRVKKDEYQQQQIEKLYANKYNQYPCFINGAAGTGKTILLLETMYELQKFDLSLSEQFIPAVYFSLSDELCDNAHEHFLRICKSEPVITAEFNDTEPKFCNFAKYCAKEVNINLSNTLLLDGSSLEQESSTNSYTFKTSFFNHYRNKKELINRGIDAFALWTEIRGTIKGYMGNYWSKDSSFWIDQHIIDAQTKKFLINEGQYDINSKNKTQFRILTPSRNKIQELRDKAQDAIILNDIDKIADKYFLLSSEKYGLAMSREDYYDLARNKYDESTLKLIYEAYVAYEDWCYTDKSGVRHTWRVKFDENDLACALLNAFYSDYRKESVKKKLPFSRVFVDEVQDMTQTQIYVISLLIDNRNNIFVAGDINQTIYPTTFTVEQLHNLFYEISNQKSSDASMRYNHRNPAQMKEFLDCLAAIRRRTMSANSIEDETTEAIDYEDDTFCNKYFLSYNKQNLESILSDLGKYPDAAIIVPSAEVRSNLLKSNLAECKNIFTVAEIKGQTFKYVFCYNIISEYSQKWQKALSSKEMRGSVEREKRENTLRYYFNLFYVAITRSTTYLCIMEQNLPETLNELKKYLTEVEKYSAAELNTIPTQTYQRWMEFAQKNENAGSTQLLQAAEKAYMKASQFYGISKKQRSDSELAIVRCRAKRQRLLGEYLGAWKTLVLDYFGHENFENGKLDINVSRLLMSFAEDLYPNQAYAKLSEYILNGIEFDDFDTVAELLRSIDLDYNEHMEIINILLSKDQILTDIDYTIGQSQEQIVTKLQEVRKNVK